MYADWKINSFIHSFILPRVHAGEGGVMVWGAFYGSKKFDLVVLDGNLNQRKYRRILEGTLLPFA